MSGQWLRLREAAEFLGVAANTLRSRRTRDSVWSRLSEDRRNFEYWCDDIQRQGPECGDFDDIGPRPVSALGLKTRDDAGIRTGPTRRSKPVDANERTPLHDVVSATVRDRPLSAWDAEKRRLIVKIQDRVSFNLPEERIEAILQILRLDDLESRLGVLRETYEVPRRRDYGAVDGERCQVHVGLRDVHVGDGSFRKKRDEILDALGRTMDRALRLLGPDRVTDIVLPIGSDFCTIDTWMRTTTKGTQLFPNVELPYDMYDDACELIIACFDTLRAYGPVLGVLEPGNHDRLLSFSLAKHVEAWFRGMDDVRVLLDTNPRTYFQFGEHLICYHHGHLNRPDDLRRIIPAEARAHWATSRHCWCFVGHQHHWKEMRYSMEGLTVLQCNTPAESTLYERENGWFSGVRGVDSWIIGERTGYAGHLPSSLIG